MKLVLKVRPHYLYTEWDSGNSPKTLWLKVIDMTKPITFLGQVRWRVSPQQITVCCCGVDNNTDLFTPSFSQWYSRRDVPMLKSALQKSIRRGLTQEAMQVSWQLINIDCDALLRRICVIMIEDVVLSTEFSTLVWLVSAVSKGYKLRHFQVMWLLGLVHSMCTDSETEPFVNFVHKQGQPDDTSIVKDLMTRDELNPSVLLSVMFRVSYGGMPCDLELFRHCVLHRMRDTQEIKSYMIVSPVSLPSDLQRCNIPLVSADFHCFPQILGDIHNKFPSFGLDEIKSCLWEYNSKINYRKDPDLGRILVEDPSLRTMWGAIHTLVSELQRKYIV